MAVRAACFAGSGSPTNASVVTHLEGVQSCYGLEVPKVDLGQGRTSLVRTVEAYEGRDVLIPITEVEQ